MGNELLQKHKSLQDFYNIPSVKRRLDSADPVRGAFELAYSDTQRTLRGMGENANRKEIRQSISELVYRMYSDAAEHFNNFSLRDYDGTLFFHSEEIIKCGEKYNQKIHFGQAQKIINMFFKYMLLIDERLNLHINYFHVPLDGVMLRGIIKNFSDNDELVLCAKKCMPWSKMDMPSNYSSADNYYMRLQDGLRKMYENPIIFEFDTWSKWK